MFKKIIFTLIFLILGVFIGILFYLKQTIYTPFNSANSKSQYFTVKDKISKRDLATELHSSGLIKSAISFEIYTKVKKMNLQTGQYKFAPSMTIAQIARDIAEGKVAQFKITFPEGYDIAQMADRLASTGLISKNKFIEAAKGEEGYLFPDTYNFSTNATPADIVKIMKNDFKKRTANITVTPDVVILASIVEREAGKNDDRALIAGVYAKRLKEGMRLEADPTVQYAKGSWDPITQSDYQNVISLYNTYLHAGLPPGPICNPGLKSLEAAANPTITDYEYFFQTKDGRTIYSKTYAEHTQNIAKYRAGTL